jgi:hypothetical protein
MRQAITVGAALVATCAVGFVLRFAGIGHLLPTITQLDAATVVDQVAELRASAAGHETKAATPYYPHLLARVVSWLPAPPAPDSAAPADVDEHLRRASATWIQVREVSVALSMLLVPLTWLFARRFLGPSWALLPAALVATSLLHVTFSAQERPHGAAASFMLLAVLAAMHLRRRPAFLAYLLAGLASGLAVGSLHYGAFALFSVIGAFVLVLRRGRSLPRMLGHSAGLALAILVFAVFLRALYPFQFGPGAETVHVQPVEGESAVNLSGHAVFLDRFRGGGFVAILSNLLSYDPVLLAAAAAGLLVLAFRLRRGGWRTLDPELRADALVAASFLAPFLLALGLYDDTFERFLLATLPFLATAGAYGLRAIAEKTRLRASSRSGRLLATSVVAGLAPALALVPAANLAIDRASPDTLRCAAAWIRENVGPEDRVVVVPYIDLPLLDGDLAMADNAKRPWGSNWTRYQMKLSPEQKLGPKSEVFLFPGARLSAKQSLDRDPTGYFQDLGARYVVLGATDNRSLAWWRAREILLGDRRLVSRFSCAKVDSGSNVGFLQRFVVNPLRMPFFLFVILSARMGPVIEIFRLDPQR